MSWAVKLILGVSVLAMAAGFAGCDSGGSDGGGAAGGGIVPAAGAGNGTAGTGSTTAGTSSTTAGTGSTTAGTGGAPDASGGAPDASGVPLAMSNGWVSGADNTLKIQGAVFTYSDPYTKMTLTSNLDGVTATTAPPVTTACIKGVAPLVPATTDKTAACNNMMFMSPGAMDCYGEYWGAAIGMNLNQMIDPGTMMGTPAAAYDASALKGFAFEISGTTVPSAASLRFKVNEPDPSTVEYCSPIATPLKIGQNVVLFADLYKQCYLAPAAYKVMPTALSSLTSFGKIAWQVVTKNGATVPFDFCISNVRAILK